MRQIITVPAAEFDRLVEWTRNPGEPSEGLKATHTAYDRLLIDRRTCSQCGCLRPSIDGPCPNWLNHKAT